MRNQRARYQTESTTGNRYLKAYNTYLTEKYQPAYTAAYQYKPVVDSAYRQYKSAFDTAKGEYDQLFAKEKASYESALGEAQRLQGVVTQANTNYANYKKTNLDPYEAEYSSREQTYQTAKNKAFQAAEQEYSTTSQALATAYNTAFDAAASDYDTKEASLWGAFDTAATEAEKLKKPMDEKWARNQYVNKISAYISSEDKILNFDSYEYLGDGQFNYTYTSPYTGNKFEYLSNRAPDTYDANEGYMLQAKVDMYNSYLETYNSGDRSSLPDYVSREWLQRVRNDIENGIKSLPKTQAIGERERSAYQATQKEYNEYVAKNVTPAKNAYESFVATSKQSYADSASATQLKAYQDFVATSSTDYATSKATAATTSEAQAVQDYVSTLNAQREAASSYYNQNVQPAQNTYDQYISNTYNPAKQSYEQVANDTNYVTSRISAQKTRYESAATEFNRLKTVYEGMQPTLDQLKTDYQTSVDALSDLSSRITDLERSVQIDLDPRKSATRVGQRQSILTRGSKRAGAAR